MFMDLLKFLGLKNDPFEVHLTFNNKNLEIKATLKNVSNKKQTFLNESCVQQSELILIDSSGKKIFSKDMREEEKSDTTVYKHYFVSISPGQEKALTDSVFTRGDGSYFKDGTYRLVWGPYEFKNIEPGVYKIYLIWKSEIDSYYDENSKQLIKMQGLWLGTITSNEIEVQLPYISKITVSKYFDVSKGKTDELDYLQKSLYSWFLEDCTFSGGWGPESGVWNSIRFYRVNQSILDDVDIFYIPGQEDLCGLGFGHRKETCIFTYNKTIYYVCSKGRENLDQGGYKKRFFDVAGCPLEVIKAIKDRDFSKFDKLKLKYCISFRNKIHETLMKLKKKSDITAIIDVIKLISLMHNEAFNFDIIHSEKDLEKTPISYRKKKNITPLKIEINQNTIKIKGFSFVGNCLKEFEFICDENGFSLIEEDLAYFVPEGGP